MRPSLFRRLGVCALACAAAGLGQPAAAQLIGGGGLGGPLGGLTNPITRPLGDVPAAERLPRRTEAAAARLKRAADDVVDSAIAQARELAAQRLIREHPEAIEADDQGRPVVRGEVLAIAPSAEALEAARREGFREGPRLSAPELGLDSVILSTPPGMSARDAVRRLRARDPQGLYDFDHIYQESGSAAAAQPAAPMRPQARRAAVRIGLVDGSAAASHPALRGVRLTQQAFGPGGAKVSAHGTAVASLLVGAAGRFRGAAPGAELLVADVYGPTPAGGSAATIARGLAWLAQNRVGVVNISLVGPPNLLLQAAVRGLLSRGALLVAAVGNDGPAAPPLYPAAYPGVVAVTAVDARRRVLPEAGRGPQLAFAAPGADMAAAGLDGGFVTVRGTSFAAPIVAAELAADLPAPEVEGARAAVRHLAAQAQDLGAPGRDPVFGYGLVGFDRRIEPAPVQAAGRPLRGP